MNINTTIIHQLDRTDRIKWVNALKKLFPKASVMFAHEMPWVKSKDERSILGCCISHLFALKGADPRHPHLVLEDDARLLPEGDKTIKRITAIPKDCGVLLLGSETPAAAEVGLDEFYLVGDRIGGTHAVLYNLPVLVRSEFFLHAFEAIASKRFGNDYECWETTLLDSLQKCGLKVLRPKVVMPFVTHASISSRTGQIMNARNSF